MSRILTTICIVLLLAGYATADMAVWFEPVDNSAALSGYQTWDVMLASGSEWLDSEMLVSLDSGSAFQATGGGDLPPDPANFASDASLEFDTFLSAGSTDFGSDPAILGGAVDIGGESPATLDASGADVTWCPVSNGNVGELCMARITISSDANGTWAMRIANLDEGVQMFMGDITTGAMLGGTPPQNDFPGDANGDGTVDDADATILATNWQTMTGATWSMGDFNNDGKVDDSDATILATNWQKSATVGAAAVPEPAGAVYLLAMLLLAVTARKRTER